MNKNLVGSNIKYFRERRGYSLEDLEKRSGVPSSILRDIESGDIELRLGTYIAIARALDVRLSKLFESGYGSGILRDALDWIEDFTWLVKEAIKNDLISMSRGAEMLRISVQEMMDIMRAEHEREQSK